MNREALCKEFKELCQSTYTSRSSRTDIPGLQNDHFGYSTGNELSRCKDTGNPGADDDDGSTGGQVGCCAVADERVGVSGVPE
jgi:hypothetical protein